MKKSLLLALALAAGANSAMAQTNSQNFRFRLITLDPGHFHAALVQKFMYPDVDPVVRVYAPAGDDLSEHLKRIEIFNSRPNHPTSWREKVYAAPDFLNRMLVEKAGNVVVIAGNNFRKTDYILRSVRAGLNVLADKPMAITPGDFAALGLAFAYAETNHVLLYDIMTERFEITTQLQRELTRRPDVFGTFVKGTLDEPAITMQSVHYFSKTVAGVPLKRPQWFFDTRQEGEAMTDVATHLVDLVQWELFPQQSLMEKDVDVLHPRHWPTSITREQFKKVTGADEFPGFLRSDVHDGVLKVLANGEINYTLRGIHAKVTALWDFEAPPGSGDTHFSVARGTKANLMIRQGAEQKYKPVLYVEKNGGVDDTIFEKNLNGAIADLQQAFPGIGLQREDKLWRVTIPEKYDVGHEAHFAQVTENFLGYLRAGKLPDWETPNMLVKYATVIRAYQMCQ